LNPACEPQFPTLIKADMKRIETARRKPTNYEFLSIAELKRSLRVLCLAIRFQMARLKGVE
jgi:hypothetical protein